MLLESRKFGYPTVRICPKKCWEAEPRAEPSDFRTIGQFGSARLSVGQAKDFGPRLGRRSDRGRNFVRMPTPAFNRFQPFVKLSRSFLKLDHVAYIFKKGSLKL